MNIFSLVFAEIRYRMLNVLMGLLAIAAAAALFVAGPTLMSGYAQDTKEQLALMQQKTDKELALMQQKTDKELKEMDKRTKRIMRDMGINLRIVHKDTDMGGLYTDFVAPDFPEHYMDDLAHAESVETIVHLVAKLQEKIKWNGRNVFLVGIRTRLTDAQIEEGKSHLVSFNCEPGRVYLGSELGAGTKPGDKVEVLGTEFVVQRVMPEYGTEADATIMMNLADAQKLLDREGRVNEIQALTCKCKGDRISAVRAELEGVLPDTKVVEINNMATAREMQRELVVEKSKEQKAILKENRDRTQSTLKENRDRTESTLATLVGVTTPLAVLFSALLVALLTWLNVRERRPEIGVLRALGKGTTSIAGLFLGKAALLGLVGGIVGCGIGFGVALLVGNAMAIPRDFFQANPVILAVTILGAPLIAALAAYLPTLIAVNQDPAVVLMDH
jgi:putative ABC transport system permease protein